jgi:hypothetical protein
MDSKIAASTSLNLFSVAFAAGPPDVGIRSFFLSAAEGDFSDEVDRLAVFVAWVTGCLAFD